MHIEIWIYIFKKYIKGFLFIYFVIIRLDIEKGSSGKVEKYNSYNYLMFSLIMFANEFL